LTGLALRSKAHWGYDAAFMQRAAPALDFTARDLEREAIYVLETGPLETGAVAGFYALRDLEGQPFLDDLWVEPARIGAGHGKRLWLHALATARGLGWTHLLIESDPDAEGFYLRMGARRLGERRSSIGRLLPLLRFDLDRLPPNDAEASL
jgi:GNAT superfamily N-acetyltransferase